MSLQECAASELKLIHPRRVLGGALTPGDLVKPLFPLDPFDAYKIGIIIQIKDHYVMVLWSSSGLKRINIAEAEEWP